MFTPTAEFTTESGSLSLKNLRNLAIDELPEFEMNLVTNEFGGEDFSKDFSVDDIFKENNVSISSFLFVKVWRGSYTGRRPAHRGNKLRIGDSLKGCSMILNSGQVSGNNVISSITIFTVPISCLTFLCDIHLFIVSRITCI